MIGEITVSLWHTMHWKSYAFYYLREGTSDELNNMHEDLAFNNSQPGVCWGKATSEQSYPVLSTDQVTASSFTDVLESEWTIVLNWSYDMYELAIDMHDVENHASLGM